MSAREAELRLTVGEDHASQRLDIFLAGPLGSRARAQRLIDSGVVLVDGVSRPKRHQLSVGAVVSVLDLRADVQAPTAGGDAPFTVVFEDEHLLVVDKPAGVVVHPARGHREGTLAQALEGRAAGGGDPERPGIVHRLDRDTSGLMVVARSAQAHRRLKAALSAREIEREYLVLVEGRPSARSGTIDAPLGRDRRRRTRISIDTDDPREARTDFELERALPSTSLLRVRLQTGRTHQIRAHMKAIGHPPAGDPEYGTTGVFGLRRQFLHATRLAFVHPFSGERVEFHSPLPDDLQAALRRAETGA
jgi:23S rRNA pseudouridine1911/1915/1917 synthase